MHVKIGAHATLAWACPHANAVLRWRSEMPKNQTLAARCLLEMICLACNAEGGMHKVAFSFLNGVSCTVGATVHRTRDYSEKRARALA